MDIEQALAEKSKYVDKIIERYIPRAYDLETLTSTFGPPRYEYNVEAANRSMAEPIWDLLDRGGKRWRPFLFLQICEVLGRDSTEFEDFSVLIELVHNGSLMVDDIEDSSELRRGQPCVHRKFGVDIAVNAANAMYYLPLLSFLRKRALIEATTMVRAYEAYSQELINIHLGQGMDISWHRGMAGADTISEAQYLQMCALKTGTLARLSARLAAIFCDADEALTERLGKLAECLGVGFQIQDDVLNLTAQSGKSQFVEAYVGSDISEGKRTLMVIHTLQHGNGRQRLLDLLNMHTKDKKLTQEAIAILRQNGSIDYARQKAREVVASAWEEVRHNLEDSAAKQTLAAFVLFAVERDY
ncbi:MAG: polyprenyl synthetase family protein [Candidatus Latescibacteria bacterium]|nr:polyprenyl synthetase family protein [Candidatus Latescibacterota bacterium]